MKRQIHYAWIVLFVTFLALLAVQGVRLSFGAFIEPWETEFSIDRGTISLISTLSFIVYGMSQPVVGKLVDRFGARMILSASALLVGISIALTYFVTAPWQLFFLYGVVASLGVGGASNVAAAVVVTNWFQERRGLAFGLMEAGFSVGQMIVVPASLFLIHWYDWQMAVAVLGAFLILIVFPVLLLLLRNQPSEKGTEPIGGSKAEGTENETDETPGGHLTESVFRTRKFWFLILPFFICGFTTTGLMDTHLIPFAQLCGFSAVVTGSAVSLLAAFNTLGTLLSGVVADRWSNKKLLAFLYAARAATIVLLLVFVSDPELLMVFVAHPSLLFLFSISFGLVDFATVAPTQMLATQYFSKQSLGFIVGWLFLSHQMGSALGAYLPGLLFSQTETYHISFYIAVVLLGGAAVLNLLLPEPGKMRMSASQAKKVS
ncbi:MFS transporter [Brevibacillus borstelensis]|uniref:MFS transporter n=1 Tax=Brevibacillus borstelensis TaxID=45462 RepID=UPI0030C07A42